MQQQQQAITSIPARVSRRASGAGTLAARGGNGGGAALASAAPAPASVPAVTGGSSTAPSVGGGGYPNPGVTSVGAAPGEFVSSRVLRFVAIKRQVAREMKPKD